MLFRSGAGLPGKGPWKNKNRVPESLQPALVGAFNGGFMLRHMRGGYFTEGVEVKPLRKGHMTVGVRNDGRLVIGVYGVDLVNDGTWTSLRQNLPPVVLNGKSAINQNPREYWGDLKGEKKVFRSGLCVVADGRMMYTAMAMPTIEQFAEGLIAMGCVTAMAWFNGNFTERYWTRVQM